MRPRSKDKNKKDKLDGGDKPDVDCYLIALSRSSACDEDSRDLSLFNLVFQARHALVEYGLSAPYTAVFMLECQRTDLDVEVRTAWQGRDPQAPHEPAEEPKVVRVSCPVMYLRRGRCRLPAAPGAYDLVLDWRLVGGVWTRARARFPVLFEEKL